MLLLSLYKRFLKTTYNQNDDTIIPDIFIQQYLLQKSPSSDKKVYRSFLVLLVFKNWSKHLKSFYILLRNILNHRICWCSWKLLRTFWDTNYCNGYYCDNGTLNSSANLSTFYFRPYNILLKIQYIQCTPMSNTTMTNSCQNIYLLHIIWTSNVAIF